MDEVHEEKEKHSTPQREQTKVRSWFKYLTHTTVIYIILRIIIFILDWSNLWTKQKKEKKTLNPVGPEKQRPEAKHYTASVEFRLEEWVIKVRDNNALSLQEWTHSDRAVQRYRINVFFHHEEAVMSDI